ncbi:hypothetical protein [Weeksella sp. HMSC059D05]|uniref:hypothetical protein n=1 Tax=Weeksella sp. HMSC059D05 TaxID=1715139 RepID=UPI0008A2E4B3|nr:hypothetical protein [Weeksella sp. HMSC059D05]OFM81176.1 hypothetical protein HMPREF2660_00840 [Weeksella sp. HMSC059D05]
MKTITTILLALFSLTISYAQDGKPTKEETLQYIKSELNEIKVYQHTFSGSSEYKDEYIYKFSDMKMKNCVLDYQLRNYKNVYKFSLSKGDETFNYDGYTKNYNIDISKTESIETNESRFENKDENGLIVSATKLIRFIFKQKNDNGNYEYIPMEIGTFDDDFQDYKSLKIYKAFQHLRKLCNAPEPISFD